MKISTVKGSNSDASGTQPFSITPNSDSISKTDGAYTLEFKNSKNNKINQIIKDLEITFDKGGLYFTDGAKVTVTSEYGDSLECSLAAYAFPAPVYQFENTGTEESPVLNKLIITGLWSDYKMKYFSFLDNKISFTDATKKKMTSVKAYLGTETKATLSNKDPMTNDNKYMIQFDSEIYADKIEIELVNSPPKNSNIEKVIFKINAINIFF